MDEEIKIINSNTRNEKIKSFIIKNKKKLIITLTFVILSVAIFFIQKEVKYKKNTELSNLYNNAIIKFNLNNRNNIKEDLIILVNEKNKTYSPLALYFLIDNNLIKDLEKMNALFEVIINKTDLELEVKNLVIYKKGLYNSNSANENELMNIVKPIINSESIWKSHALYLVAEYFYEKNEKQKAKEFFNKILNTNNSNYEIRIKSQKRLSRDFSE